MRWQGRRRSSNVEDRRGRGGGGLPIGTGGIGCGGLILIVVLALVFGVDPLTLLEGGAPTGGTTQPAPTQPGPDAQDPAGEFSRVVLASTEDVWEPIFQEEGAQYRPPTLVLYDRITPTACGTGSAATGPFYCPGDDKIYLDLSFLHDLQRMGARGDFAPAYVIAHEVGHHVQRLTGVEQRVRELQQRAGRREANQLSVLMELQADCFAGVWAHYADQQQSLLEEGDIEEGLNAAAAVGDDRLQQMSGRTVSPDNFTHGSSQQRATWFRRGYQSGDTDTCNTFAEAGL